RPPRSAGWGGRRRGRRPAGPSSHAPTGPTRTARPASVTARSTRRSPNRRRDEHVLAALVAERLAREAAVERLDLEPRDVEEPEPLVLRRPPEGARRAVVQDDVDAVVADRVPDRV